MKAMPKYKIPFKTVVKYFEDAMADGDIKLFEADCWRGKIDTFTVEYRKQVNRFHNKARGYPDVSGHVLRLRGDHVDLYFYINERYGYWDEEAREGKTYSTVRFANRTYDIFLEQVTYEVNTRKNIKKAEDELMIFLLTNI